MMKLLKQLCFLAIATIASTAEAAPTEYRLDPAESVVGFTYDFQGRDVDGRMPVAKADLSIDFNNLSASRALVELDVRKAKAGFAFATTALRGPNVLNSNRHPRIRFVSTRFGRTSEGAWVDGEMTIRGVTRLVRLQARFFRTPEADLSDLSSLDVLLTGSVDRFSFGASGFPAYVGPNIDIRIKARIEKS
ncbi:MAG: YceI family protein, partial [Pseudomonadota bacterium]